MKKWFRKADDMEMRITLRAQSIAFVYSVSFVAIWVVSVIKTGEPEFLPVMLITSGTLIPFFV